MPATSPPALNLQSANDMPLAYPILTAHPLPTSSKLTYRLTSLLQASLV